MRAQQSAVRKSRFYFLFFSLSHERTLDRHPLGTADAGATAGFYCRRPGHPFGFFFADESCRLQSPRLPPLRLAAFSLPFITIIVVIVVVVVVVVVIGFDIHPGDDAVVSGKINQIEGQLCQDRKSFNLRMVHDVTQSGVGTGSKTFTRALVKDDVGQTFTVPAEDPAGSHGEQRLIAIQHHEVSFPGFDQRGSGGHELVRGIVVIIGSEDRHTARRSRGDGDRHGPFRRRRRCHGEPLIRPGQMILLGTEERRRHHFFTARNKPAFL